MSFKKYFGVPFIQNMKLGPKNIIRNQLNYNLLEIIYLSKLFYLSIVKIDEQFDAICAAQLALTNITYPILSFV
jgi:hypothetical protein